MKTLIAIWVAALISGAGTVTYVNAAINQNVARSQAEQLQPAATVQELQPAGSIIVDTYNPQQTIEASQLQGTINGKELQRQADLSSVGN